MTFSGAHGEPDAAAPIVCVIASDATEKRLSATLQAAGHEICGPETVGDASVVIAEAENGDPAATVRRHRASSRADAAIIVVLDASCPPESVRAASEAGAFACLRPSLAPADVEGLVAAASAKQTTRTGIADRSRPLDLESHLASIGRFTAGLLHELKNPLAVVEMNVNLVRDELGPLNEARQHLRAVVEAAREDKAAAELAASDFLVTTEARVGDLEAAIDDARSGLERMRVMLNRLHDFARKGEHALEPTDVGAVVADVCGVMTSEIRGVDVEILREESAMAFAVREHVHEIVRHLLTNALDAAKTLSSPRVRVHVYVADGERVVVSVRDNGPGIPQSEQEAIFEPFFTTRRRVGATGLGLAICREYAAQMGAQLSVWSIPGRGACFRLHMRCA